MLSKISEVEKDKYFMILLMCITKWNKTNELNKTKNKLLHYKTKLVVMRSKGGKVLMGKSGKRGQLYNER